jgi:branched-chain amino acid transport system substrate-binding protein
VFGRTASTGFPAPGHSVRSKLAAVFAAGALALTAACASESDSGPTAAEGGEGGSLTLQVGILTAETGPLAGAGKAFLSGARVAEEQINANDVIGSDVTFELAEQECSEDPARCASAASQMASDQDNLGLICCILSPVAGAVKPQVIQAEMPTILYGATEVGLAEPPYVFRTTTMPHTANEQAAETIDETGVESVAYVVMTDNAGIVSQAEAFKKGFGSAGVESLGEVGILAKQTDFAGSAASVMEKDPDAIVVSATQAEAVGMIAALHDRGYDGQILTGETVVGPGVYESNSEALTGVPFPVYFLASETTPEGEAFVEAYEAANGTVPDSFAAQGYNAVYVMAAALREAGDDPTRESLAEALNAMATVPDTIYGEVTFEDGQMFAEQSVKIVNYSAPDGEIVPWDGADS